MGKYSLWAAGFTTATTLKTVMAVSASAAVTIAEGVEYILTGSGTTTAADTQHQARGTWCTFAGLGTAATQTPEPWSQSTPAAKALGANFYSAEPTVVDGALPIIYGFNQRGGMRWAVPQGEGLLFNESATKKGLVFQVISSAAGLVDGNSHWWEK